MFKGINSIFRNKNLLTISEVKINKQTVLNKTIYNTIDLKQTNFNENTIVINDKKLIANLLAKHFGEVLIFLNIRL